MVQKKPLNNDPSSTRHGLRETFCQALISQGDWYPARAFLLNALPFKKVPALQPLKPPVQKGGPVSLLESYKPARNKETAVGMGQNSTRSWTAGEIVYVSIYRSGKPVWGYPIFDPQPCMCKVPFSFSGWDLACFSAASELRSDGFGRAFRAPRFAVSFATGF